ncbi:MlaE family ABC transporter permease [Maritalea sp.]|uniref:MlaE family ABC transporter permease n=1 Tax=Maritalea sp. TaxID=2003361 RepID=UPI003EF7FE64
MRQELTNSNKLQSPPELDLLNGDTLDVKGDWTAGGLVDGGPSFETDDFSKKMQPNSSLTCDLSNVSQMDTFGAVALAELGREIIQKGHKVEFLGGQPRHIALVNKLVEMDVSEAPEVQTRPVLPIDALGRIVVEAGSEGVDFVAVQGRIIVSFFNMLALRGPISIAAIVNQFQEIVLRAIPIVILISLVVGVILTQQSVDQLRNFGAIIFVVDLSGILMLREVGILLAAIMVAGRSGSAITAEIGAMKMREEIDALEVMGLDTYRAVVMPRVMALIVGLPILGLVGAIAGITGAALAARVSGGIAFDVFLARLNDVVNLQIVLVGLIKAPLMALAIAIISVEEGLQVSGSTQSLGRHTTASVVKSIFMVIVLDGLFAVYFGAIGF